MTITTIAITSPTMRKITKSFSELEILAIMLVASHIAENSVRIEMQTSRRFIFLRLASSPRVRSLSIILYNWFISSLISRLLLTASEMSWGRKL